MRCPRSAVGECLPLILACALLRTQVGELELRASAHPLQAQQISRAQLQIHAPERARECARVVKVVERHLIEKPIGAHRRQRREIAAARSSAANLTDAMPGAEPGAAERDVSGGASPDAEAAAAGD